MFLGRGVGLQLPVVQAIPCEKMACESPLLHVFSITLRLLSSSLYFTWKASIHSCHLSKARSYASTLLPADWKTRIHSQSKCHVYTNTAKGCTHCLITLGSVVCVAQCSAFSTNLPAVVPRKMCPEGPSFLIQWHQVQWHMTGWHRIMLWARLSNINCASRNTRSE